MLEIIENGNRHVGVGEGYIPDGGWLWDVLVAAGSLLVSNRQFLYRFVIHAFPLHLPLQTSHGVLRDGLSTNFQVVPSGNPTNPT